MGGAAAPHRAGISRSAALAAVIAVSVLVALLLFGSGGDTYALKARFINAGQLVKGNLVELGGVPIGKVTGFKITDNMRQRLVATHARGEDGSLAPIPFELEQNPEFHMGGGGLYGTAGDYIKFTQMILNKGRGNGNQLLKAETVAQMAQNNIGDLTMGKLVSAVAFATNDVDLYPDMDKKWGLSFLINTARTPEGRSPGSLAWAGLANTYFWIDPSRHVAGVILMQVLPFADQKCLEAFAGLERGVYAGLDAAQRAA